MRLSRPVAVMAAARKSADATSASAVLANPLKASVSPALVPINVAGLAGLGDRPSRNAISALLQTKGAVWLADLVVAQFGLKNATALFVLAVLGLTVIHLGFASATALASAMIPFVIAVLQGVATPGISIVGMTMLLQFVVSFGFILVVNAPQNMVAYGTETFEARDFARTGLVLTVIALGLVLAFGATYWRWLGYALKTRRHGRAASQVRVARRDGSIACGPARTSSGCR